MAAHPHYAEINDGTVLKYSWANFSFMRGHSKTNERKQKYSLLTWSTAKFKVCLLATAIMKVFEAKSCVTKFSHLKVLATHGLT